MLTWKTKYVFKYSVLLRFPDDRIQAFNFQDVQCQEETNLQTTGIFMIQKYFIEIFR